MNQVALLTDQRGAVILEAYVAEYPALISVAEWEAIVRTSVLVFFWFIFISLLFMSGRLYERMQLQNVLIRHTLDQLLIVEGG